LYFVYFIVCIFIVLFLSYSLTNFKIQEINVKDQEESYKAMLQCVEDIYNDGNLKVPEDSKLQ